MKKLYLLATLFFLSIFSQNSFTLSESEYDQIKTKWGDWFPKMINFEEAETIISELRQKSNDVCDNQNSKQIETLTICVDFQELCRDYYNEKIIQELFHFSSGSTLVLNLNEETIRYLGTRFFSFEEPSFLHLPTYYPGRIDKSIFNEYNIENLVLVNLKEDIEILPYNFLENVNCKTVDLTDLKHIQLIKSGFLKDAQNLKILNLSEDITLSNIPLKCCCNCQSLERFNFSIISKNLQNIGKGSFKNCKNLKFFDRDFFVYNETLKNYLLTLEIDEGNISSEEQDQIKYFRETLKDGYFENSSMRLLRIKSARSALGKRKRFEDDLNDHESEQSNKIEKSNSDEFEE